MSLAFFDFRVETTVSLLAEDTQVFVIDKHTFRQLRSKDYCKADTRSKYI